MSDLSRSQEVEAGVYDTGIRQMRTSFMGLAGLTLLIARLDPCPCVPENVNQQKLKWDKVRLKSSLDALKFTPGDRNTENMSVCVLIHHPVNGNYSCRFVPIWTS